MELVRAPFDSYESIGRRIGVSGTAIKARLTRMESDDIFFGFACGPSPAALGLQGKLAVFAQAAGDADLDALTRAAEVAWASSAYPSATVAMLYRADADAPLPDALVKAAGRAPDALVTPHDPRETATRAPLSPLDWRVMRAVMDAPRAPVRDLAAATGLGARTVRDRRDRMLAAGDLMMWPIVDATREEGAFLFSAYVGAERAEDLRGLRVANAHRVVTHHSPPGVFFTGYVRTFAEAHVVEEKLRALPGVRDVTFSVPQGTRVARERLAAWVDAEIKKWDQARRNPVGAR